MAGEGSFITARFGYLNLSVVLVSVKCKEKGCILQRVSALFRSRQRVGIPYDHRDKFSVVNTEMKLSVFSRVNITELVRFDISGLTTSYLRIRSLIEAS